MANDSGRGVTPETDDPIRYLEAMTHSTIVTEWRWQGHDHGVYRVGELSALTGRARSRMNFDHRWECDECHPYKAWAEGGRIIDGFDGHDMWVSVIRAEDRDRGRRKVDRAGLLYVALPVIMGHEVVVMTTGPLFKAGSGSQFVGDLAPDIESFIREVVMPLRWAGSISSSQGFLPPARKHRHWEAHHPDTGRRCWHLHDSMQEAQGCRDEIGQRLDGSTKGWYGRGCSEWRMVGRIGVPGFWLERLLDEVGIASLSSPILDRRVGEDRTYIEFGPVSWDDPRFVRLRERAKWTTPARWTPPPLSVTIRIQHRVASSKDSVRVRMSRPGV
jgi:hypothetical protein